MDKCQTKVVNKIQTHGSKWAHTPSSMMTVFTCVNVWWVWLKWGDRASTQWCWCVWRLSLSVDRQCGNMSGIALTHQPTDCMTSALRFTHPALRHSSSIYTEQVKIILAATSFTGIEVAPSFLLFVASLVDSTQNIAHIPIKPLCATKFKAL